MPRLYLDHNAGRPPLAAAVSAAAEAAAEGWANPHSAHADGRGARRILERARSQVAALVGRPAGDVFFTSGGTEAAHAALTGAARARRAGDAGRCRIVLSALEHAAVHAAAAGLGREGFVVTTVPAGKDGVIEARAFVDACTDDTAAAALIAGQNEIGTLQPVEEVAAALAGRALPLLVDAVQLPGLVEPLLPSGEHVLGMLSSHKMGGLAGAGAVVASAGIDLMPLLAGGEQERRRRAGTPPLSLIAAMGAAAEVMARRDTAAASADAGVRRDRLEAMVRDRLEGVAVVGATSSRLATTSALWIEGTHGEDVVAALDLRGISASAGAACSVGSARPSAALEALGFAPEAARGLVRLSLGGTESDGELERAAEALVEAVTLIRRHATPAAAREPA